MAPTRVSVTVQHDTVAEDGVRYISVRVGVFQDTAPVTVAEHLTIGVWIPYQETITVAEVREAAIAKAQSEAELFANIPRSEIEFVPEWGTKY